MIGRVRGRRWALLAMAGCFALPAPAGRSAPPPPPPDPVTPRRHVVEIRGMAFHPEALELAPGDTVVWINRDLVPHTATAAGREEWDTGTVAQGDSAKYVPRRSGTVAYLCALHPVMRGRLIVADPRPGGPTGAE